MTRVVSLAVYGLICGCSNAPVSPGSLGVVADSAALSRVSRMTPAVLDADGYVRGRIWGSTLSDATNVPYYSLYGPDRQPQGSEVVPCCFGAEGMTVDRAGTLYVTNPYGNEVDVYAFGATKPTAVLQDPGAGPVNAVVGDDGTLYVANLFTGAKKKGVYGNGNGNVVAYARGATEPTATYADARAFQFIGVAVDRDGEIFASYRTKPPSVSSSVATFLAGHSKARETGIALPSSPFLGFSAAGGAVIDDAGHLLVDSDYEAIEIYGSKPPYPHLGSLLPGTRDSYEMAFGSLGKRLYLAHCTYSGAGDSFDVYAYDDTRFALSRVKSIAAPQASCPTGIAVTPSLSL